MVQHACAFFYSICSTDVSLLYEQAMDSKILGERLRQIRLMLGLTQKDLAEATHLTQPVMSRLENGEEVFASVLLAVLYYYQGKISLDRLFAQDFIAAKEKLLYASREEMLQKLVRQLDLIADTISEANETSLAQISRLKKEVL
jgi:Helix-turn-helix.